MEDDMQPVKVDSKAKTENGGDKTPLTRKPMGKKNSSGQYVGNMGGPTFNAALPTDPDMDSNEQPSHLSSHAADPGEFKASARESKRSLEDGRDD